MTSKKHITNNPLLKPFSFLPKAQKIIALEKRLDTSMQSYERCKREKRYGGMDRHLTEADTYARYLAMVTYFHIGYLRYACKDTI